MPLTDGRLQMSFSARGHHPVRPTRRYLREHHLDGQVAKCGFLRTAAVDVDVIARPEELQEFVRWFDQSFGRNIGKLYSDLMTSPGSVRSLD